VDMALHWDFGGVDSVVRRVLSSSRRFVGHPLEISGDILRNMF